MTKITLTLEDSKVQKLNEKTESYGLKLEQFVITAYKPDLEHFESDYKTRRLR